MSSPDYMAAPSRKVASEYYHRQFVTSSINGGVLMLFAVAAAAWSLVSKLYGKPWIFVAAVIASIVLIGFGVRTFRRASRCYDRYLHSLFTTTNQDQ